MTRLVGKRTEDLVAIAQIGIERDRMELLARQYRCFAVNADAYGQGPLAENYRHRSTTYSALSNHIELFLDLI